MTLPATMLQGAPARGLSAESSGMLLGLIGVAIFALTLPFTRLAIAGGLEPTVVALGRAVAAALLAAGWLTCKLKWERASLPPLQALPALASVAIGCVIGFPWLSSIAMRDLPAAHAAVLCGIMPLATAAVATVRGNERPSAGFWAMGVLGSILVIVFALRQSGGTLHTADLLMLGAVALGAFGYAEGGRLAQSMGGEAVICWALVLAAPFAAALLLYLCWANLPLALQASPSAWMAFAYVSAFSMLIGFFFWYRGMARGGVARVGQVQLLQPFLTLLGAALIVGEKLDLANVGFALAVIAVVALGRRMRVARREPG